MPIVKSPHSGRTYFVPAYDMDDFILDNSNTKEKISHDEFNNAALTKPMWNLNTYSTKVDEYRDIPIDGENVKKMVKQFTKSKKPRSRYNY